MLAFYAHHLTAAEVPYCPLHSFYRLADSPISEAGAIIGLLLQVINFD